MFDVAVVGAGPAGATAALCLARRGCRVTLFGSDDRRPVGETLPPEITPVLRNLGLFDDFMALHPIESPGTVSIWGSAHPQHEDFVHNPHGSGWHIDRAAFERMLRRAARHAGAEVVRTRLHEMPSGLVIDATGANALRHPEDVLLAIVLRLEGNAGSDLRTYIETAPDGWWYSAPVPQGGAVAMFFTDPETYREQGIDITRELSRSVLTRSRVSSMKLVNSQVVQARCGLNSQITDENRLCVGDSASAYDPVSGLGIWKALRTGALASDPLACADLVRHEYAAYSARRYEHYARETRWSATGFWQRRLARRTADAM